MNLGNDITNFRICIFARLKQRLFGYALAVGNVEFHHLIHLQSSVFHAEGYAVASLT